MAWLLARALLVIGLVSVASAARAAEPVRSFANEIACGKAPGLTAGECRKAFALARAEYLAKTRSYPSRFACYRAYGPCNPWPADAGLLARFRPQLMGFALAGPATARTAVPVIAAGKVKIAVAAHGLSDPLPAMADAGSERPASTFTGAAPSEALCRQIAEGAARAHLPPAFLARLLWQESSFRPHVVSRAGALGIAQ
ncbi:MAG: transglycosylase SLT domain-containing protein, partial [Caulobacteraceae bacterium]|nr:transglycosylase SLT domain-containing protein [Caulobacter sp.]